MATATIISSSAPYFTVRVDFADQSFEQTVIVAETDQKKVNAALKAYADEYEAAWSPEA